VERAQVELASPDALARLVADLEGAGLEDHEVMVRARDEVLDVGRVRAIETTDGQRFDSSYERNEPATFPVNGVIPGFAEGLQLMVEGEQRLI